MQDPGDGHLRAPQYSDDEDFEAPVKCNRSSSSSLPPEHHTIVQQAPPPEDYTSTIPQAVFLRLPLREPEGNKRNNHTTSEKTHRSSKSSASSPRRPKPITGSTESSVQSSYSSDMAPKLKDPASEVNRMNTFDFIELFSKEDFKGHFDLGKMNRLAVLDWVYASNHEAAKRIVRRMRERLSKANERQTKKGASSSKATTIDKKAIVKELSHPQVLQTFSLAVTISAASTKEPRVFQMFKIIFMDNGCRFTLVNATSFIPSLMKQKKILEKRLSDPSFPLATEKATMFDVLLWLHCASIVDTHLTKKKMGIGATTYKTGNVIGFVVYKMTRAWGVAVQKMGQTSLHKAMRPYFWFNKQTGTFNTIPVEDGYCPTSQYTSLLVEDEPSTDDTKTETLARQRSEEEDKAYRHFTYAFFKTMKDIITDSATYTTAPEDLHSLPPIRKLSVLPTRDLPNVFAELDDSALRTLKLSKPQPSPLEVFTVGDNSIESIGDVPQISSTPNDATLTYQRSTSTNSLSSRIKPTKTLKKRSREDPIRLSGKRRKTGQKTQTTFDAFVNTKATSISSKDSAKETVPIASDTVGNEVAKLEEELVDMNISNTIEMDENVKQAYEKLQSAMTRYAFVCTANFDDLENDYETETGITLSAKNGKPVDLLLSDPPYEVRSDRDAENSEHDILEPGDMKKVADLAARILRPGGHGILFCAFLQFRDWFNELQCLAETKRSAVDGHDTLIKQEDNRTFTIETVPLHFLRGHGFYNSTPYRRKLNHTNMMEIAIHFWRAGLLYADELKQVDYSVPPYVPSTYPSFTNIMDNIPRVPPDETVYSSEVGDNGRRLMLRPEQKSIACLKTLVAQYCPPGGYVVDPFGGTFATAKACLSLPKHRVCITCDKDPECIEHALPSVVQVFAKQVLNANSDITQPPEIEEAAHVFLRYRKKVQDSHVSDAWKSPPGLPPLQYLPEHILRYIATTYKDYSMLIQYKHASYIKWSTKWKSRFNQLDVDSLLATELCLLGLELRKSTIPNAGLGIFAGRDFGKNETIGLFYGMLLYDNVSIGAGSKSQALIGEGILAQPRNEFAKWSTKIKWEGSIANSPAPGDQVLVWVYPHKFCAMRYINDARDVSSSSTATTRSNNVRFVDVRTKPSSTSLQRSDLIKVTALRNIRKGEELFIDYGVDYDSFDK